MEWIAKDEEFFSEETQPRVAVMRMHISLRVCNFLLLTVTEDRKKRKYEENLCQWHFPMLGQKIGAIFVSQGVKNVNNDISLTLPLCYV